MAAQKYALLAAVIFAIAAIVQLARALRGWPVTVETGYGTMSVPLWPNWIAFVAFGFLAWLGFKASRS